jgi:two-component system, sensor histidine kinase and response regulator
MSDTLDPAAIVAGLGGGEALARKAARAFLEEAPRLLARIGDALATNDAAALARAAHTLKSAVGNFPAPAAVEAAQRLEERGRRGDLAGAEADRAALERAVAPLSAALGTVAREGAGA